MHVCYKLPLIILYNNQTQSVIFGLLKTRKDGDSVNPNFIAGHDMAGEPVIPLDEVMMND